MDGVEVSGGQQRATPECHAWNVSVCVLSFHSLYCLSKPGASGQRESEIERVLPEPFINNYPRCFCSGKIRNTVTQGERERLASGHSE